MLILLENEVFYSSGDGGGKDSKDDKKDEKDSKDNEKDSKDNEDKITLTKLEFEEKLKQKFAEGARKAQEGKLGEDNKKDEKTNESEKKGEKGDDMLKEVSKIKDELAVLKAEKIASTLGVKASYTEDVVALVRGKGLELNEENLKKEVEKHPEWKQSASEEGGGVFQLGGVGGKTVPGPAGEKEQAQKLFKD